MNTEEDALTTLCEQLGSPPAQARTMARQLLKRAEQLAAEKGISRVAAMQHLLELVTKGSRGETATGFEGVRTPPGPATSP